MRSFSRFFFLRRTSPRTSLGFASHNERVTAQAEERIWLIRVYTYLKIRKQAVF